MLTGGCVHGVAPSLLHSLLSKAKKNGMFAAESLGSGKEVNKEGIHLQFVLCVVGFWYAKVSMA